MAENQSSCPQLSAQLSPLRTARSSSGWRCRNSIALAPIAIECWLRRVARKSPATVSPFTTGRKAWGRGNMKKRVMLSLFAGCVAVFGVAVAMDMNGPLGPGGGGINSDIGTNPPITTNNPSGSCCGHVVMRIVTNELSNLPHPDALCTGCCVRMRLDWYPGNGHCKNMIVEVKQVPMNPPAYAFGLGPDCDSATLTQFDFSTVCNTNGYTNFWVKGVHIADTNKIVASMYNCCGGLCSLCSEQPFPLPVVDLLSATGFPQVVPVDSNVTFTALMNPPGYGTNVVKWSGGGTPSEGTGLNFTTRWSSPGVHIVHARCGMAMDCGNFVNATATILKVDFAMDGNRDGDIDFNGTNDNHFLFWVNDDHDCLHFEEGEWHEDDSLDWADGADTPNCDDDRIGAKGYIGGNPPSASENHCRRDLEDFTRLHIRVDDTTANMSGITYWMKFENVSSGSPSANIFEAINEGLDYLENGSIADQQIQKTRLITVGTSEVQLPNQYIKTGSQRSPFILEGKTAGKGDLTIIVKKGNAEVCRKTVTLELRPIGKFYQVFQVATVGQNSTDVSSSYNPDFTSSDDYLLFVHGFNVNAVDKTYWPGTVFKRLWLQGYKGHVGFFSWPCVMFSAFNLQCYDDSEYNAWRCGAALSDRINQLNSGVHSGKVRLLAHSQGNVVAGEALRLASGQVVHTYIATQAAVPADCYQSGVSEYFNNYSTPNVFLSFPPTANTYLTGVSSKAGQLFSYYNTVDYALHSVWVGSWEWNNSARPDLSYWYAGPRDTYDTSAQPTPSRFYYDVVPYVPPAPRDMVFANDTFEIFSYAAEARGSALGVQSAMDDFSTFNLRGAPLNYDQAHYSHSRQFRSNIVDEWEYWSTVKQDCGF